MQTEQHSWQNGPKSDEAKSDKEWRSLQQKAERSFRNGALSVFSVMLIVGAFWVGLQAAPLL